MAKSTTSLSASKLKTLPKLIVGIDPSSGVSSPVGLSIIDTATMEIVVATNLFTKHRKVEHRIRDLANQLAVYFQNIQEALPDESVIVAMETFVMVGKSGQILQNARGAFMSVIPYQYEMIEVHNTKLKNFIANHGAADKKTMGRALEGFFKQNETSLTLIKELTDRDEADIIDSICIGVYAWENLKKR